ncbi:hypothetical protein ASG43_07890 [Aureimonas sp. Leaf454]|nr:hypothetical protein ASG43_07890 [Aureimonas sp. Leaf454]
MATIAKLRERGELIPYKPTLGKREFYDRDLYIVPELKTWFSTVLPTLVQIDESDIQPKLQVASLLKQFVTGRQLQKYRQFKRLKPIGRDVWELKSPDVRIFGWFFRKDFFIAVCADSMERTKVEELYEEYICRALDTRAALDLDEPKHVAGADYNDVISD